MMLLQTKNHEGPSEEDFFSFISKLSEAKERSTAARTNLTFSGRGAAVAAPTPRQEPLELVLLLNELGLEKNIRCGQGIYIPFALKEGDEFLAVKSNRSKTNTESNEGFHVVTQPIRPLSPNALQYRITLCDERQLNLLVELCTYDPHTAPHLLRAVLPKGPCGPRVLDPTKNRTAHVSTDLGVASHSVLKLGVKVWVSCKDVGDRDFCLRFTLTPAAGVEDDEAAGSSDRPTAAPPAPFVAVTTPIRISRSGRTATSAKGKSGSSGSSGSGSSSPCGSPLGMADAVPQLMTNEVILASEEPSTPEYMIDDTNELDSERSLAGPQSSAARQPPRRPRKRSRSRRHGEEDAEHEEDDDEEEDGNYYVDDDDSDYVEGERLAISNGGPPRSRASEPVSGGEASHKPRPAGTGGRVELAREPFPHAFMAEDRGLPRYYLLKAHKSVKFHLRVGVPPSSLKEIQVALLTEDGSEIPESTLMLKKRNHKTTFRGQNELEVEVALPFSRMQLRYLRFTALFHPSAGVPGGECAVTTAPFIVTTRPEQQAEAEAKLLWKHFEALKRDPARYRAALHGWLTVHFRHYTRADDGTELARQLDSELLANLRYKYLNACPRCGDHVSAQLQPCGCFDLCTACFEAATSAGQQVSCKQCKSAVQSVQESDVMTKEQWSAFWRWFGGIEATIRQHAGIWNQQALHGVVSRRQAEQALRGQPPGTFLLRLCGADAAALVVVMLDDRGEPRHVLVGGPDLQDLGLGTIVRELGLQRALLEDGAPIRREQLDLPGVARPPPTKQKGHYLALRKRPDVDFPPVAVAASPTKAASDDVPSPAGSPNRSPKPTKRKREEPMEVDPREESPKRQHTLVALLHGADEEEGEEHATRSSPVSSPIPVREPLVASPVRTPVYVPCYWQVTDGDERQARLCIDDIKSIADLQRAAAILFGWNGVPEPGRCQWFYAGNEGSVVELPLSLFATVNAPLGAVLRLAKALWVRMV